MQFKERLRSAEGSFLHLAALMSEAANGADRKALLQKIKSFLEHNPKYVPNEE